MRKYLNTAILILSATLLMFASCALESDYSGTQLSDDVITEHQVNNFSADLNSGNQNGISVQSFTGAVGNTATETIDIVFEDTANFGAAICSIDATSIGAVTFYNLVGTDMADGAPLRGTALVPALTEVDFDGLDTTVTFTFDFTNLTTVSQRIEFFIDPTVLTANNGNLLLNLDGDTVSGEAAEDDYVDYVTVAAGTAVATASTRSPRSGMILGYSAGGNVGDTTITFAANYTGYGTMTAAPLSKAIIDAAYLNLEEWNPITLSWGAFAATSTYTDTAGVVSYVITHRTLVDGDIVRMVSNDPYNYATTTTVEGYIQRDYWDASQTVDINLVYNDLGTGRVDFNTGYTIPTISREETLEINAVDEFQLVYTLDFSGIGAEGLQLASITNDNLKLWDNTDNVYIPWTSVVLEDVVGITQEVVLTMDPGYMDQNHDLVIHIGPGLIDLGATTATTDDLYMGDYTNTFGFANNFPHGFRIFDPADTI